MTSESLATGLGQCRWSEGGGMKWLARPGAYLGIGSACGGKGEYMCRKRGVSFNGVGRFRGTSSDGWGWGVSGMHLVPDCQN